MEKRIKTYKLYTDWKFNFDHTNKILRLNFLIGRNSDHKVLIFLAATIFKSSHIKHCKLQSHVRPVMLFQLFQQFSNKSNFLTMFMWFYNKIVMDKWFFFKNNVRLMSLSIYRIICIFVRRDFSILVIKGAQKSKWK